MPKKSLVLFIIIYFMSILSYAANNVISLDSIDITIDNDDDTNTSISSRYLSTNKELLHKKDIKKNISLTLGKALEKTPGVNAEQFGPNASRPTIRSLSGNRVGILSNNLPMNDIAAISGNMPIPIDLSLVNSIEVAKGSASVINGNNSIGGSINIVDERIPSKIVEKRFQGNLDLQTSTNNGRQESFMLDANNGENLAIKIQGADKHVSAYKIPSKTKFEPCYTYNLLHKSHALREQCQVKMSPTTQKNKASYKYFNQDRLDNLDSYNISEMGAYSNFSKTEGWKPNPLYVEGSPDRFDVYPPAEEYESYPDKEIPNSFLDTKNIAIGTSYITDKGNIGVSVNNYKTHYGVPGYAYLRFDTTKTFSPVSVKAENTRIDLKGNLYNPTKFLTEASFFFAYTNSLDQELVGSSVASNFKSKNNQAKLELIHQPIFNNLYGVIGVNFSDRKLKTSGHYSYLPSVNTKEHSIYILETLDFNPVELQAGYSTGKVAHRLNIPDDYDAGRGQGGDPVNRDFNVHNNHLSMSYSPLETWSLKLQNSYSQRAPEINELYAHGPHYAVLLEEQGYSEFEKETVKSLELTSTIKLNNFSNEITIYKNKFKDFKFLRKTGMSRGVEIREWDKTNLNTKGIEFSMKYQLNTDKYGSWTFGTFGDWVKNKATQDLFIVGSYLPNLPNSKYGASLDFNYNKWFASTSATHFIKQKETGNSMYGGDVVFPGYTMVNFTIGYKYKLKDNNINFNFKIDNLTNTEARPNSSQLKYLSPLPGRSFNAGIQFEF